MVLTGQSRGGLSGERREVVDGEVESVPLVAQAMSPDSGLQGGVGGDFGDDGGLDFGEGDAVPAAAEPVGQDAVRPRVFGVGGGEDGGEGTGFRCTWPLRTAHR